MELVLMFLIGTAVGVVVSFTVFYGNILLTLRQFEIVCLRMLSVTESYNIQAIKVLHKSYEAAKTYDENLDKKEYLDLAAKISETFSKVRENAVENVKKCLPYETKYSNWKEAADYLNKKK
jgi:hypothetical protein